MSLALVFVTLGAAGEARASVSVGSFAAPEDLAFFAPEVQRVVAGSLDRAGIDVATSGGLAIGGRIEALDGERVRLRAQVSGRAVAVDGELEHMDELATQLAEKIVGALPASARRAPGAPHTPLPPTLIARAQLDKASPRIPDAPIVSDKIAAHSEVAIAAPASSPARAALENPVADRAPIELSTGKEVDRPVGKPVDKVLDQASDKPVDKPVDKSVDKPVETDKSVDKPVDKPLERAQPVSPSDRTVERRADDPPSPPRLEPPPPADTLRAPPVFAAPPRRWTPRAGVLGRAILHRVGTPQGCDAAEWAFMDSGARLERQLHIQIVRSRVCGYVPVANAAAEAASMGLRTVFMIWFDRLDLAPAGMSLRATGSLRVMAVHDGRLVYHRQLAVGPRQAVDSARAAIDLVNDALTQVEGDLMNVTSDAR